MLQKNNIALFVATIINFQERYCGINATSRPFTRYPFEIFRDYKIHGHLHLLLRIMISYLAKEQWFQTKLHINQDNNNQNLLLDLNDTSLIEEYINLFTYCQTQLIQKQIIRQKVIYFSPLIPMESQQRLAQIARTHGAQISDNNNHLVTHVCTDIFFMHYFCLNIERKDKYKI